MEKNLRNAFISRLPRWLKEIGAKKLKKAITGIMLAIMAMSVFSFVPNFANADTQSQGMWVRMNGYHHPMEYD